MKKKITCQKCWLGRVMPAAVGCVHRVREAGKHRGGVGALSAKQLSPRELLEGKQAEGKAELHGSPQLAGASARKRQKK